MSKLLKSAIITWLILAGIMSFFLFIGPNESSNFKTPAQVDNPSLVYFEGILHTLVVSFIITAIVFIFIYLLKGKSE